MPRRNDIAKILIIGWIAILFLLCLIFPRSADACVISPLLVHVSPGFRVLVQHGATPIPGIRVDLYDYADLKNSHGEDEWNPILTFVTDKQGAVPVQNLRKGRYLVETKGPGGGSAVYAEVGDKPDNDKNEISLEWPFSLKGTLKTRSLSGELVSNNPWTPFQSLNVQLWAAGLETPLDVEDTGPQGRFRFNETRPGLYVVSIRGRQGDVNAGNRIEGYLSVELAPSAPDAQASLSLRLGMTTCGIEYSSCPAGKDTTIATASRRFKVAYGPGIVAESPLIADAKYRLLDDRGFAIAQGATDHDGIAELPSELMGKVTLVVGSPGLMTVQQSLDLLPPDEGAPYLLVAMTMLGPDTGCSTVSLEKNATPQ